MGCDGGTIPRRDELVKTKKRAQAKDKSSELAFQWLCCAISQQLLLAPVVMCGLGRLYNKLAVIENLLNKTMPLAAKHIKNLKDVKELKLAPNPEYRAEHEKKDGSTDDRGCPFICPIAGLEMSGMFKFVALWSCGCVISERAFKQIDDKVCINCQTPFTDGDVVILNAKDEDLELMKTRMENRQANAKKNKEKKSKIKKEVPEETIVKETEKLEVPADKQETAEKQASIEKQTATDQKTPVETQVTAEKQTTTEKQAPKRPSPTAIVGAQLKKKVKDNYSVAKDPQVSDVYKSLFTSHKSEKEQTRAHWVTYNPFYN